MTQSLLTAAIGILGVLVGYLLQQIGQKRKFLNDSKYEAYILFLRSLAGLGATKLGSKERWTFVSGMIEAKSRIALFGSQSVVSSLAKFSARHKIVDSSNFDELAHVIKLMREDIGSERIPGIGSDLRRLLFE